LSRKVKVLKLGIKEERELEEGYKYSPKTSYSRRCHIILLKSKGYTSKEELESTLDKDFSMSTLTRFLKLLAAPTDEFD
jgi:hypothetical protein